MPKPGWLDREFEKVSEDIKNWPAWMRREAGLEKEIGTNAKITRLTENVKKTSDKSDKKKK